MNITARELCGVIFALKTYQHYIIGSPHCGVSIGVCSNFVQSFPIEKRKVSFNSGVYQKDEQKRTSQLENFVV